MHSMTSMEQSRRAQHAVAVLLALVLLALLQCGQAFVLPGALSFRPGRGREREFDWWNELDHSLLHSFIHSFIATAAQ